MKLDLDGLCRGVGGGGGRSRDSYLEAAAFRVNIFHDHSQRRHTRAAVVREVVGIESVTRPQRARAPPCGNSIGLGKENGGKRDNQKDVDKTSH